MVFTNGGPAKGRLFLAAGPGVYGRGDEAAAVGVSNG